LFNDVSALTQDPASLETAAELLQRHGGAVCLMHAQGDPQTMQDAPRYGDVLAEVAAFLAARMDAAEAAGAPRSALIIDPGIGFGKTLQHNLALLNGLGALQSLGAPLLLGVSRKRFIGALSGEDAADRRLAGSLTAALHGVAQGAQILRVHDVAETVQALRVWRGLTAGSG
ncbi:MAG: dihydropteroate synthase, partial [Pseudomonadota bacterium]